MGKCLGPDRASRPQSGSFPASLAVVLLAGMGLAGCSAIYPGMPELPRDGNAVDLSGVAVVVGSVTQTDSNPSGRNSYTDVTFQFTGRDSRVRFRVRNAQLDLRHWSEPDADRGLENIHGRLFALMLPPGTYQLEKITLWFQATVEAAVAVPLQFTVAAGEVVYIGNLEVENCFSVYVGPDGQRVRSTVLGGFPTVNDRGPRDLVLLRETYPALKDVSIESGVLDGREVAQQAGDELSRRCSFERGDKG
jgi:hypothetical protein